MTRIRRLTFWSIAWLTILGMGALWMLVLYLLLARWRGWQ